MTLPFCTVLAVWSCISSIPSYAELQQHSRETRQFSRHTVTSGMLVDLLTRCCHNTVQAAWQGFIQRVVEGFVSEVDTSLIPDGGVSTLWEFWEMRPLCESSNAYVHR